MCRAELHVEEIIVPVYPLSRSILLHSLCLCLWITFNLQCLQLWQGLWGFDERQREAGRKGFWGNEAAMSKNDLCLAVFPSLFSVSSHFRNIQELDSIVLFNKLVQALQQTQRYFHKRAKPTVSREIFEEGTETSLLFCLWWVAVVYRVSSERWVIRSWTRVSASNNWQFRVFIHLLKTNYGNMHPLLCWRWEGEGIHGSVVMTTINTALTGLG